MKNIFTDRMKCLLDKECNNIEEQQTEIQINEIQEGTESKLDFQLFDLDRVFAN